MTYRFQLAHLRVFQSYLERIYPSNDSGFDLIFFPIFFFNFRIPNHRSYVDCRKTKKRFAVHPSHYFPVKKLLKHVGTHLKSRLDAIQGSDYFSWQTDRLTERRRPHASALYIDHSLCHPLPGSLSVGADHQAQHLVFAPLLPTDQTNSFVHEDRLKRIWNTLPLFICLPPI